MVGIYEIGVQLGTTIGFWIIYAVKQTIPTSTTQWRFPVAFQLIPGGILMIGMAFLPESPRWVALHQGVEDAHRLLAKIRQLDPSHPYVEWEMQGIVEHNGKVQSNGSKRSMKSYALRYKELALPGIRNRLLTGTILMIFFQMSGTNAINYYSPLIFKSLGFKGASSQFLATGIYGIIRFVCTLVAMLFVVDRVGRRKLIIIGSVIMGLCMWYIGAYLSAAKPLANGSRPESAYSAIVFIYVYAAAFCFSYAGIPWIYCSEIFPVSIRTHCTSITAAVHWIFNLLLARAVPYMIANIGASTYFVFGACLTVSVPWAYFFMPETRGLSLEDMEALWTEPSPTLFVRADRRRNMVLQRQNFAAAVQVNEDVEISSKGSHIEKSIENMY
jgi:sugar porter (SP) family MFS transporter